MINKWLIGKIMFVLIATMSIPLAASDVQVGMDASGNGIAAWINYDTSDINISYFNGTTQTWSDSVVFGSSYNAPAIAVSPSGNAALVWIDESNVTQATYYTAATNTWSSVQALSSDENYAFSIIVEIADDLSGTAIVIWEEAGVSTPVIRASCATATGGGVWSASTVLSD